MLILISSCQPNGNGGSTTPISTHSEPLPFSNAVHYIAIDLNKITIIDNNEINDTPYLWPFLIILDTNSITTSDYVVSIDDRGHGNIPTKGMDKGDSTSIPSETGHLSRKIDTILFKDFSLVNLIVIGWEEDNTPNSNVIEAYDATAQYIEDYLYNRINSLNFENATTEEINQLQTDIQSIIMDKFSEAVHWYDPFSWDPDDFIGAYVYSQIIPKEYLGNNSLSLDLSSEYGDYLIDGQLSIYSEWDDVANYSTIQTAVINGELYLLARSDDGLIFWKYNVVSKKWTTLSTISPNLTDSKGWSDISNYSTIQTAVVNNKLYLIARGDGGMGFWEYTPASNSWSVIPSFSPDLADSAGWNDVSNYSTIQTAVVNNELYLIARADAGMSFWKYVPASNSWAVIPSFSPDLADSAGWNDVSNYSTIQTAVVNNELYLIARGDGGMGFWRYAPANNSWAVIPSFSPDLADSAGWNDVSNYSTIQTAVVNNELYLIARADAGMSFWKYVPASSSWAVIPSFSPNLADSAGWNDVANYSTIQTAVVNNELFLIARADASITLWKYDASIGRWIRY